MSMFSEHPQILFSLLFGLSSCLERLEPKKIRGELCINKVGLALNHRCNAGRSAKTLNFDHYLPFEGSLDLRVDLLLELVCMKYLLWIFFKSCVSPCCPIPILHFIAETISSLKNGDEKNGTWNSTKKIKDKNGQKASLP